MSDILKTASNEEGICRDIDRDSAAYVAVMKAYKMPKETDREKKERQNAVQEALKEAARVPLEVAEMGMRALSLAETLVKEGNQNAITDAAVAALIAVQPSLRPLQRENKPLIHKRRYVQDRVKHEAERIEREAMAKEKDILALASSVISG